MKKYDNLKKIMKKRIKHLDCIRYLPYINFSFSEDGEDIDLKQLFKGKENGFYVDLGCFHPVHLSNTFALYYRGWRGLNVDATPGVKELFDKHRTRDINVNAAISQNGGGEKLTYYVFWEGAINTFDEEAAKKSIERGCHLKEKIYVKSYTITEILDQYLPNEQQIDFMDIDVESYDKIIISQMNWDKYRPSVVIVESARDKDSFVADTMKNAGYVLRCKSVRNDMFIRNDIIDKLLSNVYRD